jgi:sensor histidine kinase YesM
MILNNAWLKTNRYHVLVWLLFILYETWVVGMLSAAFGNPMAYIAHYLAIIFFFYFHANVAMPWAFKTNKNAFWKLPIVIIIQLFFYLSLHYIADIILLLTQSIVQPKDGLINSMFILRNIYRGIYFLGFSTGYYFTRTYINERKKTAELERERLTGIIKQQQIEQQLAIMQNAFLKAQINPHFLFNTLDFVYYHTNLHSPIAGEAIIRLSQMMRFAIDSDKMGEFISLGDEIEQVENLIYLHEIRKKDQPCISFSYDEEVKSIEIIPLVLLTLVENIFKHGDLSEPNDMALISVSVKNKVLYIKTDNLINQNKSLNSNYSGLKNIKERLHYAYGDQANFTYTTDNRNHFLIDLTIKLS